MSLYSVLVVDDSAFMRKLITEIISADPHFVVVSTAKTGKEACEKTRQLKPDVITMDVEMPDMNGLSAVKSIMEEQPTPIIMISSLTDEGARETILALEFGAVDFVCKPTRSNANDLQKMKQQLLQKLLEVAAGSKIALNRPPVAGKMRSGHEERLTTKRTEQINHMVAIGTSTGGPRALMQVMAQFPGDFAAPILIVQHMPANFTRSLAQRLNQISQLQIAEAEDGCLLKNGNAYVAPGGKQMTLVKEGLRNYRLRIAPAKKEAIHRPSVNVLFDSLLPLSQLRRHLVLLTGMGRDGADGMKRLYEAGVRSTIAESHETCVVYGMPRAAVELNCVRHLLPLNEIATKLMALTSHT